MRIAEAMIENVWKWMDFWRMIDSLQTILVRCKKNMHAILADNEYWCQL